jgi:short subunit dehydrogenase-like uncharacterized protein
MTFLVYGAYGYTGRLLVGEALRRGHHPIAAGRDGDRLAELGRDFPGLATRTFALDDPAALRRGLTGVEAVLHAAGPFIETGRPMMEAAIGMGVHYLDISGEVPSFETAFELNDEAREAGVVLLPGVGLDVIPTDAVAALLHRRLPGATRLELALHSPGRPSGGTLQTVVEGVPGGLLVRRDGQLRRVNPGRREFRRTVDFGPEIPEGPMAGRLGGVRWVTPYTWGDLATAWRTTGIDHITCYRSAPKRQVRLLPLLLPLLRAGFALAPVRRVLRRRIARGPDGPSAEKRATGRTRVWGRVENLEGDGAELVLEVPEGYRFTEIAGIRAVEALLERGGKGTLTPARAFGPDWALDLPEVHIVEARPVA